MTIIPRGLTSVLQLLYVSINNLFKDTVQGIWNQWMLNKDKAFTKGGHMRAPSFVTVCEWIRDVWQQFYPAIIRKAFLKCGILIALDGTTEDNYLWHEPDSIQKTSNDSDDDDLLDSDNDFYDDPTNTCGIEEWTELFGDSNSDDSNCFE